MSDKQPNIVIIFGDQWRGQACGYAGNHDVLTPNIDKFADESVNFVNAVSGCPVCSPYRASLMTGQYPVTHGLFLNDVCLDTVAKPTLAENFAAAGYDTAYIGKWHIDGHGRSGFIPRERRLGFEYWKVLECTHDYNHSAYYAGDSDELQYWDGYDAAAQTADACHYIDSQSNSSKPFLLALSWGPPHAPYETAPELFRKLYDPAAVQLRANVPEQLAAKARQTIAGYYAHCSALDHCFGQLITQLKRCSLYDNTIILFTSDHGDMLYSQGEEKKQRPWDESIRVPFLLKPVECFSAAKPAVPIDAPDIMPTLLGMAGLDIPSTVEGCDFSGYLKGGDDPIGGAALLSCPHPFGQWNRPRFGGCEYRGLRTARYTYVKSLSGPWLLYDNESDPLQQHNLVKKTRHQALIDKLEILLTTKMARIGDKFLTGMEYVKQWNYRVDEFGTVSYKR